MRAGAKLVGGAAALLLLLLLAGAAIEAFTDESRQARAMKAGAFDPPHQAPAFTLQGADGSEVTLARYRGKVVLLTFGFTRCAAVCPATLATLAQARAALVNAADSVQVIFVTVDPERDTAARLQRYVTAFDPSFVGATGAPEALAAVREKYGVTAEREGAGPDYAVAHTSSIFLIDRSGRLRGMMPFGRPPSDFVHDIRFLLAH
jgi:protein SCO1